MDLSYPAKLRASSWGELPWEMVDEPDERLDPQTHLPPLGESGYWPARLQGLAGFDVSHFLSLTSMSYKSPSGTSALLLTM